MDEIELLRTFRADPLCPDLGTTERARAKLRTAIALERGRERAAPKPRWRRRRLVPAVLAATAAAAIAALIVVTGSSGPGVSEAAAEALRQQARIAASQPAFPPPGPGQYLYTKSREMFLDPNQALSDGFHYRDHLVREDWLGRDGSGRLHTVVNRVSFPTAEDRATWRAQGSPNLANGMICGKALCDEWNSHGLRVRDLSRVPTDTTKLRRLIEDRKLDGGPPGDAETFVIIGDLLRDTYAPPKLRAALYRVASALPGVELLGQVRDGVGRKGVAVAYVVRGEREELIFDPKTSAILGERYTVVDPETAMPGNPSAYPAGTITEEETYLHSAVVDSRSVRP